MREVGGVGEVSMAPAPGFSRARRSLSARVTCLREPRMSGEAGYLSCFSTGSSGALHPLNWQRPGCHSVSVCMRVYVCVYASVRMRVCVCMFCVNVPLCVCMRMFMTSALSVQYS